MAKEDVVLSGIFSSLHRPELIPLISIEILVLTSAGKTKVKKKKKSNFTAL